MPITCRSYKKGGIFGDLIYQKNDVFLKDRILKPKGALISCTCWSHAYPIEIRVITCRLHIHAIKRWDLWWLDLSNKWCFLKDHIYKRRGVLIYSTCWSHAYPIKMRVILKCRGVLRTSTCRLHAHAIKRWDIWWFNLSNKWLFFKRSYF